jgi:hypothetical protein
VAGRWIWGLILCASLGVDVQAKQPKRRTPSKELSPHEAQLLELFQKGHAELQAGKCGDAVEVFRSLLDFGPDPSTAYYFAKSLQCAKRGEEAASAFRAYLAMPSQGPPMGKEQAAAAARERAAAAAELCSFSRASTIAASKGLGPGPNVPASVLACTARPAGASTGFPIVSPGECPVPAGNVPSEEVLDAHPSDFSSSSGLPSKLPTSTSKSPCEVTAGSLS